MKKLGIIGGMGPFADEAFISLLNSYSHAVCDNSHIPFLLDGNCLRPDRSDFICKKSGASPLNSLISSARMLVRQGCDCLVIPCNTAHFWYHNMKSRLPRCIDFPSIVSLSAEACAKKSKNTLLLSTEGTRLCGIYERECKSKGVRLITAPKNINSMTNEIISSVKSGKKTDISTLLKESSAHCDSIILACTELSYALLENYSEQVQGLKITDSLSVLARYVIERFYKRSEDMPYA